MGIEAVIELQNILKEYFEDIGIILEVAVESFICGQCKEIKCSSYDGEEISTFCKPCGKIMEAMYYAY